MKVEKILAKPEISNKTCEQCKNELLANEEKYQLITNNVTDVIVVYDLSLKITYVSPSVFHLRGYTVEETLNQTVDQIITADSFALLSAVLAKELELEAIGGANPKRIRTLELEEFCKDGSTIWIELSLSFIRDQNQKPSGIISINRDITKRKQIEIALRESEEKYRFLIENSHDIICSLTTDNIFSFVSTSWTVLLGHPTDQVIGQTIRSFIHPNDLERCMAFRQKIFKTGERQSGVEYRLRHINGSWRWHVASGTPIKNRAGTVIGYQGISSDITERKLNELERLKIQKIESLGVLAGGIAHDFNNLLTGIMGNASLLTHLDNLEKQKELAEEIIKATQRAAGLTRKLLIFAKGDIPETTIGSIVDIIQDSALFALGKNSSVDCEINLSDDLWLVKMDIGQIGQVIQNLVINAKQAMPTGGIIKISANNTRITENNIPDLKSDKLVRISISDTGIGIPEKYLAKIFDPYFTTKRKKEGGSGLGLTICHTVIKNHGGSIMVESKLGEGSIFHIFLPAIEKKLLKNEKNEELEKVSEISKTFKILVMDDEDMISDMLAQMLESLGHQVETAKHGEEALEKYLAATKAKKTFDLAILDLTIPGKMGGVETLQKLLLINPLVKTIVSSGYSDTIPEGFVAALTKPYTMKQLEKTIKQVMS